MILDQENFLRIKKECFWDYEISYDLLKNINQIKDQKIKKFIFEKILWNSTRLFYDLEIFDKETLKKLLEETKIPKFNQDYFKKRKNFVEVYFFNQPLEIEELKWK